MNINQVIKAAFLITAALLITSVASSQNDSALEEQLNNQTELPEQAAQNVTLPGERFYGLKTFRERIELGIARAPVVGSQEREATTLANHAQQRVAEAQGLAQINDTQRAQEALNRYSESIDAAAERAAESGNEETMQVISEATSTHETVLQRISEQVPEEAQEGIQNALNNSQTAQETLRDLPAQAGPGPSQPNQSDAPPNNDSIGP